MIHNLKIAWRQIRSKPFYSGLMHLGFAVGLATTLLVVRYIDWQWSFDRFHEHHDRIVRIQHQNQQENGSYALASLTYPALPVAAADQLTAVEAYARVVPWIAKDVLLKTDEGALLDQQIYFADAGFFQMFSYEALEGDPYLALSQPNNLVLTRSSAKSLFGSLDVIGNEVIFERHKYFNVAAVIEDPPSAAHLQFSALISYSTYDDWGFEIFRDTYFESPSAYGYLLLQPSADRAALARELTDLVSVFHEEQRVNLVDLDDIYFYDNAPDQIGEAGKGNIIWILYSVAFLILILCWINQFNLFTAFIHDNVKNLSIRKVVGASRLQLFRRILTETMLQSVFAISMGWFLAEMARPFVARAFQLEIFNSGVFLFPSGSPGFWLMIFLILGTLTIAIVPAVLYSRSTGVTLGRSLESHGIRGLNTRQILVGLQFGVILILVSMALLIDRQSDYFNSRHLGFKDEHLMAVRGAMGVHPDVMQTRFERFRRLLAQDPDIEEVSFSRYIPGDHLEVLREVSLEGNSQDLNFFRNTVDRNHFSVYNIPWIAKEVDHGNNISDVRDIVVNRRAMNLLGYQNADDILGKELAFYSWDLRIIGVVEDHHQQSLHHPIQPILYDLTSEPSVDGYYTIHLTRDADRDLRALISSSFSLAFPEAVFEPLFVDKHFDAQYAMDASFEKIQYLFTVLSVFIAIIGLIGLTLLLLQKRVREIGIRKILGASLYSIVLLFGKGYIRLMILAMPIAFILAFFLMKNWLNDFSFQVTIDAWIFIGAGLGAFGVIMVTMLLVTFRSATINPIDVLRDE